MYFYSEYFSIFNVTQKLVFTLLLFRTTRITAYDVIKSVIERSVEEAERRGTSAGESTLKSWNPVFTWSASPSFPLAIRPESYTLVIAFYNHSRPVHTHGGHVDKGKNQRARSRKGRHALLRRKAKRSLALLVLACLFCPSSRVVPWKRSSTSTYASENLSIGCFYRIASRSNPTNLCSTRSFQASRRFITKLSFSEKWPHSSWFFHLRAFYTNKPG